MWAQVAFMNGCKCPALHKQRSPFNLSEHLKGLVSHLYIRDLFDYEVCYKGKYHLKKQFKEKYIYWLHLLRFINEIVKEFIFYQKQKCVYACACVF